MLRMQKLSRLTNDLLHRAGIQRGMRVLDIGCGSGEVTRAVAALVAPLGTVVGVDSSAAAIASAKAATEPGLHNNIEYVCRDLGDLCLEAGSFDCVVGRRVLMYLPDPQNVIARLAELLRPQGRMAFQEHDATMTPGRIGTWPLHDQVHHWIWEMVRREGADASIGLTLSSMLVDAGMRVDELWTHGILAGHEKDFHHQLHEIIGFVQARIVALGIATEEEIALPSLEQRLTQERKSQKSSYVADMAVCVIASKA